MKFNPYSPNVRRTAYGYVEQEGNALYVISDSLVELGLIMTTVVEGQGTTDRAHVMADQYAMALNIASGYAANHMQFREYIRQHNWDYNWIQIDGTMLYGVRLQPNNGSAIGAPETERDWSSWLETWLNAWTLWCNN